MLTLEEMRNIYEKVISGLARQLLAKNTEITEPRSTLQAQGEYLDKLIKQLEEKNEKNIS